MAVQKHLGTGCSCCLVPQAQSAAGPATVQSVTTARQGTDLRVEVTLSSPVKPSFDTASNPDRILLDLPDTRSNDAVKTISVHVNGVLPRTHRAAQHEPSRHARSARPRSSPSLHRDDGREQDHNYDRRH